MVNITKKELIKVGTELGKKETQNKEKILDLVRFMTEYLNHNTSELLTPSCKTYDIINFWTCSESTLNNKSKTKLEQNIEKIGNVIEFQEKYIVELAGCIEVYKNEEIEPEIVCDETNEHCNFNGSCEDCLSEKDHNEEYKICDDRNANKCFDCAMKILEELEPELEKCERSGVIIEGNDINDFVEFCDKKDKEETITITKKEYDELIEARNQLEHLENLGVDNWSEYSHYSCYEDEEDD